MDSDNESNFKTLLTDSKDAFDKVFHRNFVNMKVFVLLLLIIVSIINQDTDFIKANPVTFGIETFVYGLISTLGIIYINHARQGNSTFLTYFIWFIVMCLFNVTFQLGGFYSILYPEEEPEEEKEELHFKKIDRLLKGVTNSVYGTLGIFTIICVIFLIFVAYKNWDFNILSYENSFKGSFTIETIIFGLTNSVPLLLIAYNREKNKPTEEIKSGMKHNLLETLILFVKMCLLHIVLQAGGFYKHNFGF